MKELQKQWDAIIRKHRLKFVTGLPEEWATRFLNLTVIHGVLRKGEGGEIWKVDFTNGKEILTILNYEEDEIIVVENGEEDELFEIGIKNNYFYSSYPFSPNEQVVLRNFLREIGTFLMETATLYHNRVTETARKRFETKYQGAVIQVNWATNGKPFFKIKEKTLLDPSEALENIYEEIRQEILTGSVES